MLKTISRILYFAAALILLVTFRASSAEAMNCTADSGSYVLNLGDIFVEAGVQPGNVLFVDSHEVNITCKSTNNFQQVSEVSNSGWSSSGMTVNVDGLTCPVIDQGTMISDSGLGIVWTNYSSGTQAWVCMSNALTGAPTRRGLISNSTTTLIDKIYIVKTNKPLAYGETKELSQVAYIDEANGDRVARGQLYNFSFAGVMSISAGECTVENTTNVNMGTLSSSTFSGIGSTGPTVPFSILLQNCYGAAVQAHFDFTPTYGFANQDRTVIALNDSDNAATGAGIQLMMNGKEIAGWNDNIYPITTGDNTVPFTARYYQTGEKVTPGNADTTVVFNLYYN